MSKAAELGDAIAALTSGQTRFAFVHGFLQTEPIIAHLEAIKASLRQGSSESNIYRTHGIPVYEAATDDEKMRELLEEGLERERRLDEMFYPYISPVAYWWRMMDTIWASGIQRLECEGSRLPFGLFRLWETGSAALPHQDVLRRELPRLPFARALKRQFGLNLYLCNGDGGELEVWDRHVSDLEWQEAHVPGSYGFPRSELGPPAVRYRPAAGDLAIVDTECVHAIAPVLGDRLTLSGFVGFVDERAPLVCWS